MKKIYLLLISCSLLLAGEVDYTKNVSLDIRAAYINYDYDRGFSDAEAFATSLKLKYEKELLNGLRAGVAFGTLQDLGILSDGEPRDRFMAYMFNKDDETFTLLHQAYLNYTYSKSFIEVGRFELETPLISSDDYYLLSNSFQGIHLDIKELDGYNFRAGYISEMSGSWDSAYDGGDFHSMTKQAWAHRADTGTEYYYTLSEDLGVDEAGYAYLGLEYKSDTLAVSIYDHILIDSYNSLFGQIEYNFNLNDKNILIAGQYIKYEGIGALSNNSNPDAVVDYATYSAKAQVSLDKLSIKLAYTGVTDSASIHFFGAHGAYPQFASGMMISYFSTSLRDANIISLSSSFDFGNDVNAFNLSALYAYYDLNSDYTKGGIIGDSVNGDAYMHAYGVSTKYTHDKKLSWIIKLAQRELEHGDKNLLFRTVLKYSF